jgi:hypothetical protein
MSKLTFQDPYFKKGLNYDGMGNGKKCELQHHLNIFKKSLDLNFKMDFELPILV